MYTILISNPGLLSQFWREEYFLVIYLCVYMYKNICPLNREIYQSICNIAECSAAQDGSLC